MTRHLTTLLLLAMTLSCSAQDAPGVEPTATPQELRRNLIVPLTCQSWQKIAWQLGSVEYVKNHPAGSPSYERAVAMAVGMCTVSFHYLWQSGICTVESKACKLLPDRYCIHMADLQQSRDRFGELFEKLRTALDSCSELLKNAPPDAPLFVRSPKLQGVPLKRDE